MKNNKYVIEIVFDFLKILLIEENKEIKDFLDFIMKRIKGKVEENEETEDFLDNVAKRIQENEENRKDFRKFLLEELLKSEEDEDENLFSLIELFVSTINQKMKKNPKI